MVSAMSICLNKSKEGVIEMYKICYSVGNMRHEEVYDNAYDAMRGARIITDCIIMHEEYHDLKIYKQVGEYWREM